MVQKRTVVVVTATIFSIWIFVFTLNGTPKVNKKEFLEEENHGHTSTAHDTQYTIPTNAPTEDVFLDNNMWIPAGWTGLPLSIGNPSYVAQSYSNVRKHKSELIETIKKFNAIDWARKEMDAEWERILRKYETLIGWNGIFDAVDQAQTELGIDVSRRLHVIGEVLATSPLITNPRYVVEITSRDMLHDAPMHGGVWVITKNLLDIYNASGDVSALFATIEEQLCFFKNEDNMMNMWISCVHGVGHGIGKYYGLERVDVGVEICAQHPDEQYRFSCATGIYMELEKASPDKSFYPCDSGRFAAGCFRFKRRLASRIFYDTKDPCSTQPTPYHRRGCIWGFALIKENAQPWDVYSFCEPFRPENATEQPAANDYAACFDGFLGGHTLKEPSERITENFCDELLPYETAHSICESFFSISTLGEQQEVNEEVFFYNYELLEELFDPSVLGKNATWLPEWNRIIPHMNFNFGNLLPQVPLAPPHVHAE